MAKKYRVGLTEEEQEELKALVSKGRAAAYKQTHARILLLCDENQADGPMMDQEIARALKVGTATVERVRRRCVEEGVAAPWVARSNSTAAGKIWTVRVKRIWWPWLAPSPRRDGSVGPCECWLTD